MKVILLKSVQKVGRKYDVVDVADGFAMNSLLPKGLAEHASAKALARVSLLKAQEEAERKIHEDLLIKNLSGIDAVKLEISSKANDKGHLFGGVHKDELVSALKEQAHIDILADYIVLDKPIKETGEHRVSIKVQDKTAVFTVNVSAL
jgi:large subunit ribosomal protein L9